MAVLGSYFHTNNKGNKSVYKEFYILLLSYGGKLNYSEVQLCFIDNRKMFMSNLGV